MSDRYSTTATDHLLPETDRPLPDLDPDEPVWASLALPSLTLVATDRRLLRLRGDEVDAWDYDDIAEVGPGSGDGDVVIAFDGERHPLVVHAGADDSAMQDLTVIGLLVARSRRLDRLRGASRE